VDAIEAYLVACLLDPDDGGNFSHVADELTLALKQHQSASTFLVKEGRHLPDSIGVTEVADAVRAALSCRLVTQETLNRVRRAAERAEVAVNLQDRMSLQRRVEFATALYAVFRSDLTSRVRTGERSELEQMN
jgi:hypothetical protein